MLSFCPSGNLIDRLSKLTTLPQSSRPLSFSSSPVLGFSSHWHCAHSWHHAA